MLVRILKLVSGKFILICSKKKPNCHEVNQIEKDYY